MTPHLLLMVYTGLLFTYTITPPPKSAALSFFLELKWIDTLHWQTSAQHSLWLKRHFASRERGAREKLTSWERNQSSSTHSLSNWADKPLAGLRDQQNLWQEQVGFINSWQQALSFAFHSSQDVMTLKCFCWVITPMAVCPGHYGHYEAVLIFFYLGKSLRTVRKMWYFLYLTRFWTHISTSKKKKKNLMFVE